MSDPPSSFSRTARPARQPLKVRFPHTCTSRRTTNDEPAPIPVRMTNHETAADDTLHTAEIASQRTDHVKLLESSVERTLALKRIPPEVGPVPSG